MMCECDQRLDLFVTDKKRDKEKRERERERERERQRERERKYFSPSLLFWADASNDHRRAYASAGRDYAEKSVSVRCVRGMKMRALKLSGSLRATLSCTLVEKKPFFHKEKKGFKLFSFRDKKKEALHE